MIKLEYVKVDGTRVDITKLCKTVTWTGDINSCARKLEIDLIYNKSNNVAKIDIPLSSLLVLTENNIELFRGFTRDREKENNSIKITAFDYAEKLNKIKVSYNIKNLTPTEIAKKFLQDYSFNVGNLASTSTKIKKIFIGTTSYEMIMSGYYEESKSNSKKYMIRATKDTFNVVEKGNTTLKIAFEEGKNLLNSSFRETTENMINQVIIVDEVGAKKNEVKDDNLLKVHGLFQEVYKVEEGKDSIKEANAMLKGIEQTASLEGFGDTTCITGNGVQVKDSSTGLVGLFYIDSDTHTWQGESYKISLELNFKNIMAEVEAGEEEQTESSSSSSSSSSGGNSKVVDIAKSKLGKPYVWGATGPNSFDCSGLTSWSYKQIGINIPRTSREQSQSGKSISKSDLQQGDLLFFNTSGSGVSHVGMYIGNGEMIHAPKPGDVVKIVSINSSYYTSKYVNARRYL